MHTNQYSRYAYIACVMLVAYVSIFYYPKWKSKAGETSLGWDAATYYWYLPATFIYKDLKQQKFGEDIISEYHFTPEFEQSYVHESGNRVLTYSSGLAFMHLPAFVVAHVLARPLGYPADGFSLPYQTAVQLWSIICAMMGLWFFRKLLLHYYDDKVVAITLLLLVFGSNYLNYTAIDATITHSWLFSIYVLLMLNTRQFYNTPNRKYAVRVGLLLGLAILIRPSEIIAAIIPLLWGINGISIKSIKDRLSFFYKHLNLMTLAAICTILVGAIQVVYWLYVTGQPLVYSYEGKGFSWLNPHFKDYTFSYRSGWLMYTPVLILSFIGLLPFIRNGKNKLAIVCFFLLNYYIVSAWDIWWYGGMGGRAMVQSYAVLFFSIAALVDVSLKYKWLKWVTGAVALVFVYINLWFTYNAHRIDGLYDANGMTKEYFWHVIGRPKVSEQIKVLKDTDEYYSGEPKNLTQLYFNGFEQDTTESNVNPISGQKSVYFTLGRVYGPDIKFAYQKGKADWLRAKIKVKLYSIEVDNWRMLQFTVNFYKDGEIVKSKMIRVNRFAEKKKKRKVFFDVKIPDYDFDTVGIVLWNPGSEILLQLDDVEVWSFEE